MLVGARGVHLSERIDLMAEVMAIRFVVPALDPNNAGANAAGGKDDEVGNAAIVGAPVARAAESKVMALVEHPNWNHVKRVQWRAEGGVKGTRALQKHARTDD
jgi:hypothetical protein